MDSGEGAAVERFWDLVLGLDARLAAPGGGRSLVDYDVHPTPGDTVLVYDGAHVRALVFGTVDRAVGSVWIIGVIRPPA
jgi:hypothetical protein